MFRLVIINISFEGANKKEKKKWGAGKIGCT